MVEADRRIQTTEVSDWVTALQEAEDKEWSDLHSRGAQLTLQAMATSEEPYTGRDLYRTFASQDARMTLRESIAADVHTLTTIDSEIWRGLSQRAATLTGVTSTQFTGKTSVDESDTE